MTSEEIAQFADTITYSYQRTVIHFHQDDDSNGIVGYFDNNHDSSLRKRNIWNFVRTPIIDQNNKFTLLQGEDIKRIQVINITPINND